MGTKKRPQASKEVRRHYANRTLESRQGDVAPGLQEKVGGSSSIASDMQTKVEL